MKRLAKKFKGVTTLFTVVAVMALASGEVRAAVFTAGDLAVFKTGATNGVGNARPIYIDEYTTSGTLVQTIDTGMVYFQGSSLNVGGLSLSSDGRYLSVTGIDAPLNATSGAGYNRIVERIDMNGNIDKSTILPSSFGDAGMAASLDGSGFFVTSGLSNQYSLNYVAYGSNGAYTQLIPNQSLAIGGVDILNNQLYMDARLTTGTASTSGVVQVGTGLPTTGGQALTTFLSVAKTNTFDIFMADPVTIYLSAQGLSKFIYSNGQWQLAYSSPGTTNYKYIAGSVDDGVATMYTLVGQNLVRVNDILANTNSASAFTATTIVTNVVPSGVGQQLMGLDYVPTAAPVPIPAALPLFGSGLAFLGFLRKKLFRA
ncbi:MAG: hypothetical protein VB050_17530 [Geobacteraceae bacterium]|nr:hypothetical protein [Geobacteraceae bacterium]